MLFILHRLEGMKHAQIAELYGVSVSSVEKYIIKALALLTKRSRRFDRSIRVANLQREQPEEHCTSRRPPGWSGCNAEPSAADLETIRAVARTESAACARL